MIRIDAWLSKKAQTYWPTALVWVEKNEKESWALKYRGLGEEIFLGDNFGKAKDALFAILSAEKAKRGDI